MQNWNVAATFGNIWKLVVTVRSKIKTNDKILKSHVKHILESIRWMVKLELYAKNQIKNKKSKIFWLDVTSRVGTPFPYQRVFAK